MMSMKAKMIVIRILRSAKSISGFTARLSSIWDARYMAASMSQATREADEQGFRKDVLELVKGFEFRSFVILAVTSYPVTIGRTASARLRTPEAAGAGLENNRAELNSA